MRVFVCLLVRASECVFVCVCVVLVVPGRCLGQQGSDDLGREREERQRERQSERRRERDVARQRELK